MTYVTELTKTTKEPIYFIKILRENGSTLHEFSTHTVRNTPATKHPGLLLPKGTTNRFNVREETTTIGIVDLEILDVDNRITTLIRYFRMIHNVVELYGGFDPLNEDEYIIDTAVATSTFSSFWGDGAICT